MTTHQTNGLPDTPSALSDILPTRDRRYSPESAVRFHLTYAVPGLIRDHAVKPRFGGLLHHVCPDREDEFVRLTADIWGELKGRFAAPLTLKVTTKRRTVTVLGFVRYVIGQPHGRLTLERVATAPSGRSVWRRANFAFAADLPFRPSLGLFEELLGEWTPAIADLANATADVVPLLNGLANRLRQAALQTIYWKRLRYAVRKALALDPEVLDLARRSRVNSHTPEVTDLHYNHVLERLAHYRQIAADNPNLLWLYALAHTEHVCLPRTGERLAALRAKILGDFSLPAAAWRYLANGRRRDFRVVLDWLGPNALPNGRWLELREWLRVLVALGRRDPIGLPVQRLFLHDAYRMAADGNSIVFRGVTLPLASLRALIAEAEAQLARGTLRAFSEDDLPDVLAWLAGSATQLDGRQQQAGWRYLLRRARAWKHEAALRERTQHQTWRSLIESHVEDGFVVRPLSDGWQLQREALVRRNCTNTYLADCLADTVRLFAVISPSGRQTATVGLIREGRNWKVLDVRGFANSSPSPVLRELAKTLASRYTTRWLVLHPLPAPMAAVAARLPEPPIEHDQINCSDEGDDWCGDDDEFDEAHGRRSEACPICGDTEFGCGHLVAALDYFNGGIFAGEMQRCQAPLLDGLWSLIEQSASAARQYSGLGKTVDDAIAAVRRAQSAGESISALRDDIEWALINVIYETLESLPGVETAYWEFDGGAPGMSTCGRNYWSTDPDAAMENLMAALGICELKQ
ncbi:hypothetical protein [Dechloromonas sp. H13]|uniref:hypothetical protein n=1 Tax=Dechloromonas sp. H13 TaxID=2570193 RepID=UPI001290FD8D|nr:hypothetical protein [Dechloromonas sp. H13]